MTEQTEQLATQDADAGKLAYHAPVLHEHGSVDELTKGGATPTPTGDSTTGYDESDTLSFVTEFDYSVFGLMLRVNRSISALTPSARHDAPDVRLHLLEDPPEHPWPVEDSLWQMESPPVFIWKAATPHGVYLKLRYASDDGEAEFVLDPGGTELWAAWRGRATLVDVTTLLFGAIFGCLLRHRGLTCLHGSVLGIEGQAIVLLGAKGAGKSTTALGLLQRGAILIADDLAVLDRHGSRLRRSRWSPAPAAWSRLPPASRDPMTTLNRSGRRRRSVRRNAR